MQTRRPRAFTLIEVLVVVAIIALLISILIPSLTKARDQARSAKCLANMRDMNTSANTFAQTHRGRFQLVTPEGDDDQHGRRLADPDKTIYAYDSTPVRELLVWPAAVLREGGVRSLKANSDWGILGQANAVANQKNLRQFGLMSCPGDKILFGTTLWPQSYFGYLSYAINEDVTGSTTDANTCWKDGKNNNGDRLRSRLDKVIRPGQVMLFVDGGSGRLLGTQKEDLHLVLSGGPSPGMKGPYLEHYDDYWGRLENTVDAKPLERHLYGSKRGAVNVLYVDGHGGFARRSDRPSQVAPQFIYTPKVRVSPYNPGVIPGY